MKKKVWDTDKLENCVVYLSRGKSPSYVGESKVFVLNQKAIRWGYIDKSELKYHNPDVKIAESHFIKKGDVVINSTGDITIGRAYYFNEIDYKLFADSHVTIIRTNPEKLNGKFLSYLLSLNAYQTKIYNLVTGATGQLELPKNQLAKLEVDLPPLPTQQRIASILSAYDDLIEVNNQRIKLLEQTARELYKEWFVRMRFPGYKQAKFKKGVPEGWKIRTIANTFEILGGGTPSTEKPEYWDGDVNWFTPTDITGSSGIFLPQSSKKITEKGLKESSAKLFPPYSVMMTSRATIGAVGINTTKGCTNQGFITCLPNENIPFTFLYYLITFNKEFFEMLGTGSTFLEITKGTFKKIKLLIPEQNQIAKYHNVVEPIFKQIETLQQQNTQLRQIRDRLLPRLISGKLQVSER